MMVEGCSSINQEVSYEKARWVVLYGGGSNAISDILLAGGLGSDGVYSHQFIAPAAVAIWLFLLVYSGVFDGVEERKGIYSHCSDTLKEGMGEKYELRLVFWLWTAVCLLPLVMHGGSNLLLAQGQPENSAWLFEYRYLSSLVLMIVAVVVPLVFGSKNTVFSIARNLWRRISF